MESHKQNVLIRLAHMLNEAEIQWAVGGSLMLCLRGASDRFNDIDLVIASKDASRAQAGLDKLAMRVDVPPPAEKARVFRSRYFCQYALNGVDVDMMAGMIIRAPGVAYEDPFDELGSDEWIEVAGERIPLASMEDWYILYQLMVGREEKVRMIEAHWARTAWPNAQRLQRVVPTLPERVRADICRIISMG